MDELAPRTEVKAFPYEYVNRVPGLVRNLRVAGSAADALRQGSSLATHRAARRLRWHTPSSSEKSGTHRMPVYGSLGTAGLSRRKHASFEPRNTSLNCLAESVLQVLKRCIPPVRCSRNQQLPRFWNFWKLLHGGFSQAPPKSIAISGVPSLLGDRK